MIIDILDTKTERRLSPRYELPLAVQLVLENEMVLDVTLNNISSCGLKISCDSWIADEIEPRGIQNIATSQLRLKVVVNLENGRSTRKVYANCRIISTQRVAQDEYSLNLAFVDFENGSEKILNTFLGKQERIKNTASTA